MEIETAKAKTGFERFKLIITIEDVVDLGMVMHAVEELKKVSNDDDRFAFWIERAINRHLGK